MNIVERICEKYHTDFYLNPFEWVRPVALRFGPGMPPAERERIENNLYRVNVLCEDDGLPMVLDMTEDGICTLSMDGELQYRFAPRAGSIAFTDYDRMESILWTVYLIAAGKNWLADYRGQYISCRCFSARQQAAAARIYNSVNSQYVTAASQDTVTDFCRKWDKKLAQKAGQAPRYSARPISAGAFQAMKGKPRTGRVGKLGMALYGTEPFSRELDCYLETVRQTGTYEDWVEEAQRELMSIAHQLPMAAVNDLFIAMGTYIDNIRSVSTERFEEALDRQATLTLTASGLSECFEEMDELYSRYVESELCRGFFRAVSDRVRKGVFAEQGAVRQKLLVLRNSLRNFCFMDAEAFAQDGITNSVLSWKRLASLQDSDIYSDDVSWTPKTLNALQSYFIQHYQPKLWLCSERLREQARSVQDKEITRGVPVGDEKLVWAVWADKSIG